MDVLTEASTFLAAIALGLSAGALVAEAAVLVPFWRGMKPAAFYEWYRTHASLLLAFFGPLEVVAAVLAVVAAAANGVAAAPNRILFFMAAALALAVLATFPIYFRDVNARFAAGSIPHDRLPYELATWARWHQGRTIAAVGAFGLLLLAR